MALRDTWQRALVYFGLAEDPDYREHDIYEPDTVSHGQETSAPRGSATVSRISERRRARDEIDDIFAEDEPAPSRGRVLQPVGNGADVQVHLVTPHSFNDAQEVADRFKRSVPGILNLQATEGELAKRLIDFASGPPSELAQPRAIAVAMFPAPAKPILIQGSVVGVARTPAVRTREQKEMPAT